MANIDTPFGARIVGSKSGFHSGHLTTMFIPATDGTATFINDIVKLAGSADADGIATCAQVEAGDTPCGIIVAMEPIHGTLETKHRAASTARYVWVNTDPNVLFEIQSDANGVGIAGIGQNADVVVAAGSTLSGISGMELDGSTLAGTATLVIAIEGASQRSEANDLALGFAEWVCSFNVHQYGSVGVAGS